MKKALIIPPFLGILLLCAAAWAQASSDVVPLSLVRRAAEFYGAERWPGCRLAALTPYYALDGSTNAYAAQFALEGSALAGEAELLAAVRQARAAEAAVRAERAEASHWTENPEPSIPPREVRISAARTGEARGPASAKVDASSLRFRAAERAERAAREADERAWRNRVRAAANASVLLGRVGTVIVAARTTSYPLLERFDGAAPHLKFEHVLWELTGQEPGAGLTVRAYYLGPMYVLFDWAEPAPNGVTAPSIYLVDPMNRRTVHREHLKERRGAGRLPDAGTAGKHLLPPQAFWQAFESNGAPPPAGGDAVGGGSGSIPGVPYYHQDDYGARSCGPTASAQALGYWDDNGYGNLVDNGSSTTGHENELIYDLMRAQGYDPASGTFGNQIEPGVEAVCNNAAYGNDLSFAVTSDYSLSWSEITTEIDLNRPFVYFNWDTASYPSWAHFTTGTGYNDDSNHILYVHYNYPPDTPYELNWDNISRNNEAMYRISPGASPTFSCVMSEDFEGAFPGAAWEVGSNGTSPGYWWRTSYRAHNSTPNPSPPGGDTAWSAYCVGSHVAPPGPYPDNVNGWAVYGPFSTMGSTAGEFSAYIWRYIPDGGSDSDYIALFVSLDGVYFWGWAYWGDGRSWEKASIDLTDVWTLGNVMGKSQVWVALWVHSDSMNTSEGGYFDNVVLRIKSGTTCGSVAPIVDPLLLNWN